MKATRYIEQYALREIDKHRQMLFIVGPRQSGKTTSVKQFLDKNKCGDLYFNWDTPQTRQFFRKDSVFFESIARGLKRKKIYIAFDELHKSTHWKNKLKGYFDQFEHEFKFIVTGSARLDLLRKKGDSLSGRFLLYTLLPFSLSEFLNTDLKTLWLMTSGSKNNPLLSMYDLCQKNQEREAYDLLYTLSGFPEPLTKGEETFLHKWQNNYVDLIFSQDIRDLTNVSDLDNLLLLFELLPNKVGSPLSINSLREDLQVSHKTISNWIKIFEKLYLTFSVDPYAKTIERSIKKEKKWYFYDWTRVKDNAAKFENLVACMLLRASLIWQQMGLFNTKLCYIRTIDKKEIDFLLLVNGEPFALFEAKLHNQEISNHLLETSKLLGNIPIFQILHEKNVFKKIHTGLIISADRFLSSIP